MQEGTMPSPDIDSDYLKEQLKQLLSIPSPTGYTDTIVRHVSEELDRLGIGHSVTRRGAILACYRGKPVEGARAVVAHLDTLGATVQRIKEHGRREMVPSGPWASRFAEGARVPLFPTEGTLRGPP